MFIEGFSKEVTFKQRPKRNEEAIMKYQTGVNISPCRITRKCKGSGVGVARRPRWLREYEGDRGS